ncbi:unnamed protein product [Cladocopium goreaui]|uniref:Spindle assembly abnormal protein 6 N-terminal domain-containing protein n=1 Tax=Cladocopium goreaui TaxID=2562237 RepID=A0A9P1DQ22_9DINO|nr:unnamed protein product [Cladocopium goreaui]|mmetsp:Transcript_77913/g.172043  ORF Transcript_77913/g.172043 Transcript_77913/m.172043 type:complete len:577 (-) Transcript_77913:93-1823(-)
MRAELEDEETPHTFAEEVAVLIKPIGRDHYTAQLTIRLWADNPAHPRSLLLELTDAKDLLFYHSLALGESDFHALRSEQRLLVDFQSFPEQLADLLRRCCEAPQGANSKMIASLECTAAGESRLNIVESTNFRELIHIDLRLRQGSDEVVKKHLAKKLRLCRAELQGAERRLGEYGEALQNSKKQVDELTARARVVADERSHLENSLQTTHLREVNTLKDEHARAFADLQRQHVEDKASAEARQKAALTAAVERAERAEASAEELQRARQSLTATGESCQHRLLEAEKELKDATAESSELKKHLKQLEEQKFRHERELTELKVQLASTREQLAVREQHAASQAIQIEEAVNQRRMLEENVGALKKQVQTLEEKFNLSSQEIVKGNRIIQSLHQASKESKAKLRQRATELAQFERARHELEREGQVNRHQLEERDNELLRGKAREEKLQEDLEEMKRKLLEAQDVIKSNQEVIEYLNRQLTERELKAMPTPNSTLQTDFSKTSPALSELLSKVESFAPKKAPASPGYPGYQVSSLNLSLSTPAKTPSTTATLSGSPEEDILSRPVAYRRPMAMAAMA